MAWLIIRECPYRPHHRAEDRVQIACRLAAAADPADATVVLPVVLAVIAAVYRVAALTANLKQALASRQFRRVLP
jgi:hypothetical protein